MGSFISYCAPKGSLVDILLLRSCREGCGREEERRRTEVIRSLCEQTAFTEVQLRMYFKRFRKDHPNGKMNAHDLKVMFESVFKEGDATEISEQILRMFDRDHSGTLEFGEVIMALSVTRQGTAEEKMKMAFEMIDSDANGFIERHEIIQLVRALHQMVGITVFHVKGSAEEDTPEKHVDKMMEKLDTDKDNAISFQEFCEGFNNEPAIAHLLTIQANPEILARRLFRTSESD